MRTFISAIVASFLSSGCVLLPESTLGSSSKNGEGTPVVRPSVHDSAPLNGTPQPSDTPTVTPTSTATPKECFRDGAVTTCNFSTKFNLLIDLKTTVRVPQGMDLVQIDEKNFPFTPGQINATLESRDNLDYVIERFDLKLFGDLNPVTQTQGPFIYGFKTVVDDTTPDLVGLRSLVEKSGVSGRYRFFSNSGARMFLTTLKMLAERANTGVITANLNLLYAENENQDWGPVN